ncbi:MaoC/PaaZ C-terminal domain-containing protein [Mycolicibacterium sp. P1-5]|uniref:MaoC/PaaZ C-terminal domain-containing protein n=1 Tax=Mycolicibacterium sp. P1-5 TaxID=2024617 RepID=UPI001884111A|nr:MaoC/PaaZ C-terminal domain-containing protein [Mycolicibacterium sp. P1-5]
MTQLLADDLAIGDVHDLGSHPICEAEIIDFATKWDPSAIHCDPIAAGNGYFTGIIASGIHTLAVFQRLAATSIYPSWAIIAGRRITDVEMSRPVRPGMVLRGRATVVHNQPDNPSRSLIAVHGNLSTGGRTVLTLRVEMYMHRKPT